jgi:hypothetical protein
MLSVPGSDVGATPSASPQLMDMSSDGPLSASLQSEELPTTVRINLQVNDLELLHFYTTTTSLTLSNRPELQQIWQQVVPQIAFTNHFLLHGILAFSALHLARAKPEREVSLYTLASAHHDIGVRMFRTAMSNITPQNCDACLAFSTIISAYAWASSHQTGVLFFSDTSIYEENPNVEWASLLRGVHTLLDAAGEWITSGAMELILHPRPVGPPSPKAADPEVSAKLTALTQLWVSSPGKFSDMEIEALNVTLAILLEDIGPLSSSSDDREVDIVSVAYGWPIKVPATFLAMVKELQPEALIVLAHYSLLLNKAEHVWYMKGMSRRLLHSIHSKLGKEWESWIAWPLQNLVLTEFKDQNEGGMV